MRDTLRDAKGGGRVVRGSVGSAGAIVGGTGFSVVRTGLGIYVVTYLTPFASAPFPETDPISAAAFTDVSVFSATGFSLSIFNNALGAIDTQWIFTATEQER